MTKGGKMALASTIAFAVVGITAIIVGFGLQYGFDAVIGWFASRWAVYLYIALALGAFVGAWAIHEHRMKE